MGKESSPLKKWAVTYRKTIINAICNDFTVAFPCAYLPGIDRIAGIKAGEYPGQAADMINRRLAELMPEIITGAVVRFLVIMIVLFVPILIYRFWHEHRIRLIQEMKEYLKENKNRC